MSKKELKFQGGYTVVIELIEAQNPSACRFGYKVGDSWEVNVWENSGLCGLAYNAFFPFITMFQTGGQALWAPSGSDRERVFRSCPDMRPGFRFLIKRKMKDPLTP